MIYVFIISILVSASLIGWAVWRQTRPPKPKEDSSKPNKGKEEKAGDKKKSPEKKERSSPWGWVVLGVVLTPIIGIVVSMILVAFGINTAAKNLAPAAGTLATRFNDIEVCDRWVISEDSPVPSEIEVPFRKECWTLVSLPVGYWYRAQSETPVQVVLPGDRSFIVSPGIPVDTGDDIRNTIRKIRGLDGPGIYKVFLQRKP